MIDTAEIFYHMESAVSHLPSRQEREEALIDAVADLVVRLRQECDRQFDPDEI